MESGPGTINFSNPTSATTTISATTDGTYRIRATVMDVHGNDSFDEFNLTWDTSGVVVNLNIPGNQLFKNTNDATVTPSISGEGASPTYSWTYTGSGTLTFAPNSTSRNLTAISASADGNYTITFTVTNTATTLNDSEILYFTWDTFAPVFTTAASADPIISDGILTVSEQSGSPMNLIVAPVCDCNQVEYVIRSQTPDCTAINSGWSTSIPMSDSSIINTVGSDYRICIKGTDNAGNTPAYAQIDFNYAP